MIVSLSIRREEKEGGKAFDLHRPLCPGYWLDRHPLISMQHCSLSMKEHMKETNCEIT